MLRWLLIVLIVLLGLVGCNKEELMLVQEAKEDFRVLYAYEEDKLRPVLEEEVTEEELARRYLLTRLELEEVNPEYKERGILPEQGIFIESAVYDGGSIPNITPMSKEVREIVEGVREDTSTEKKQEEFNELLQNRQEFLDLQFKTDNTGIQEVEEEIKRRIIEYEQDMEGIN